MSIQNFLLDPQAIADRYQYRRLQTHERWRTIQATICVILLVAWEAAMGVNLEGQVLISWMQTLNGTRGSARTSIDWNPQQKDPCKWTGIACSPQGLITGINLQSIQLLGTVPSQFNSLKSLQSLVLSTTNLTGIIPKEIGDYSNLVLLDLSENRLTGSIPVEIGKLKNLRTLILNSNQLEGTIPAELGNCNNLVNLLIFDNQLRGNIPPELGRLSSLEVLRAGGNPNIEGALPAELANCTELTTLGLAETSISGTIPSSFGSLKKLRTFAIYTALLSGSIPPEIGNCSELVYLYLYGNGLSGSLPWQLGRLHKLQKLLLWQNSLVGSIPPELGNCTDLQVIDVSINALSGSIPSTLGNLKNLVELQLSDNNISGSIPSAIANCTGLSQLQLDSNQISGEMPDELGDLKNLTLLFAWQNKLEGRIPSSLGNCNVLQALDLTGNRLTGSIPPSIFELQNLTKLLLLANDLTGSLSPNIGNCSALVRVRLGDNRLSGTIPKEIGKLKNLIFLEMANNQLSGIIPAEIGGCTALQMLDLHGNRLTGNVPGMIGLLQNLHVLDLSMNRLLGSIPASAFENLSCLNKLALNGNDLSGVIPKEISLCTGLQFLDLSNNKLTGGIPSEMGRIEGLDIALNLSWNALSGFIPLELSGLATLASLDLSHNKLSGNLSVLGQLENLVFLNVSFNNFSGHLPDTNFFRELPESDLCGNPGLCTSGSACFGVQPPEGHGSRKNLGIKLIISLLFSITGVMLILGICMLIRARKMPQDDPEDPEIGWPWHMTPFQKLSFSVEDVVSCLVDTNIIGKGCSGVVYRAEMPNRDVIAVKKLWPSKKEDFFAAEVKTLGSIRHRNIVRLLGYCSNNRTKLLMYDYMANGSLGELLHDMRGMLDWETRYNILLGAAHGLEYLHHHCVPAIVHRDVKANNILLGRHFEPCLADFGLAKLVDSSHDHARSSTNVAGSYGYIAPEYGYMMKITEKSDVYSYGVVLLEVLTGKQPIDPSLRGGNMHLVEWVRETLQTKKDSMELVLDPTLQGRPDPQIQEMLQALGVALLCVNSNPDERPTMKDVASLLKEIKHHDEYDFYEKFDHVLKQSPAAQTESTRSKSNDHDHVQKYSQISPLHSMLYSSTSSSLHPIH